MQPTHVYEIRPRKRHRGVDLISDVLPYGGLWYADPSAVSNAIGYAEYRSRSHDAVIRVYDEASNVIETPVRANHETLSGLILLVLAFDDAISPLISLRMCWRRARVCGWVLCRARLHN